MSSSDRPSGPTPGVTPVAGYFRPGVIYIDDSATALQTLRRALYPHTILLETFTSMADFRAHEITRVVGALFDVDLGDGASGLDAARQIAAEFPDARIAFITAAPTAERNEQLAAMGPVFIKGHDVSAVVAWLVSAAARRSNDATREG